MSLENPSPATISGLVAANPTAGDPFSQGDDHIRLIKTVLKYIFPGALGAGFASQITATEAELNYVHGVTSSIQSQFTALNDSINANLPSGVIAMWHGLKTTIPAGWVLCDGTNSTPDLTGKFVLGYDSITYPTVGAVGGYADGQILTHTHIATSTPNITGLSTSSVTHTHTTDPQSSDHTHQYTQIVPGTGIAGGSGFSAVTANTGTMSTGHFHNIAAGGAHVHDITGSMTVATTNATPVGAVAITGRNMPPYVVLCYIMKAF
jgi:hypothetical protein